MANIKLQFGELNVTPSVEERLKELGFTPEELQEEVQLHKSSEYDSNPSIYVGTYGKYNSGSLQGLWVDLTTFGDSDELRNFCYAIHADEQDPELDVQDEDCLPTGVNGSDILYGERWEEFQQYLELCDSHEVEAVDAYVELFGIDDIEYFEDRYQGKYDSEEDYARYIIEEFYNLDAMMGHLASYFDYDAFARDLFMTDYTFYDGFVFN